MSDHSYVLLLSKQTNYPPTITYIRKYVYIYIYIYPIFSRCCDGYLLQFLTWQNSRHWNGSHFAHRSVLTWSLDVAESTARTTITLRKLFQSKGYKLLVAASSMGRLQSGVVMPHTITLAHHKKSIICWNWSHENGDTHFRCCKCPSVA